MLFVVFVLIFMYATFTTKIYECISENIRPGMAFVVCYVPIMVVFFGVVFWSLHL